MIAVIINSEFQLGRDLEVQINIDMILQAGKLKMKKDLQNKLLPVCSRFYLPPWPSLWFIPTENREPHIVIYLCRLFPIALLNDHLYFYKRI